MPPAKILTCARNASPAGPKLAPTKTTTNTTFLTMEIFQSSPSLHAKKIGQGVGKSCPKLTLLNAHCTACSKLEKNFCQIMPFLNSVSDLNPNIFGPLDPDPQFNTDLDAHGLDLDC